MKNLFKIILINLIIIPLFSCASVQSYQASGTETQMTNALLRDDLRQVKALLAEAASPNSRMPTSGMYVLTIPLQNNNLEMAKLLIDAGADVNMKDRDGMPLLHLAKKAPMIRLMLEHGADMYAVCNNATAYDFFATRLVTTDKDKKYFISLLKAQKLPQNVYQYAVKNAEKNDWITSQDIIDTVIVYKDFNYDVNRQFGEEKQSLLHCAARAENYDFLSAVITRTDANVNIRDRWDVSILNIITQSDTTKRTAAEYEQLLSIMMKKGLQIDAVSGINGDEKATALMIASQKNYFSRCAALVKAGANPKIVNENHKAAINFARDLRVVKFLIDNGADPLNKDKWQQTAIFYQKDTAVIGLLLAGGVKINDQDKDGNTALFCVHDPKAVEYLIAKGMDINHLNKRKQSTIEVDVANIHEAMRFDKDLQDEYIPKFRILIKHGMNKTLITNACEMAKKSSLNMEKVVAFLKPYASL